MESRHPQEFVRAVPDQKPLSVVRPDNDGIEATEIINCNCHYPVPIPSQMDVDLTIYKGYSAGPVIIDDSIEVLVHCEWVIE